jgi:hypothetical protein
MGGLGRSGGFIAKPASLGALLFEGSHRLGTRADAPGPKL